MLASVSAVSAVDAINAVIKVIGFWNVVYSFREVSAEFASSSGNPLAVLHTGWFKLLLGMRVGVVARGLCRAAVYTNTVFVFVSEFRYELWLFNSAFAASENILAVLRTACVLYGDFGAEIVIALRFRLSRSALSANTEIVGMSVFGITFGFLCAAFGAF